MAGIGLPTEPNEGDAVESGLGVTPDELERLLFPYVSSEDPDALVATGGGLKGFAFMYTGAEEDELVLYLVVERDVRTKRFIPAAMVPPPMFDQLTRVYPFLGHVYHDVFATTAELYRITALQAKMNAKLEEQRLEIQNLSEENAELRALTGVSDAPQNAQAVAREHAQMLAWIKRANREQAHFFPIASATLLSLGQRVTGLRKKFKDSMAPLDRLAKDANPATRAVASMLLVLMKHQTEETAGIAHAFEELHGTLANLLERYNSDDVPL